MTVAELIDRAHRGDPDAVATIGDALWSYVGSVFMDYDQFEAAIDDKLAAQPAVLKPRSRPEGTDS